MDLHPIRPGINYWSNWVEITEIVWPLTGNVMSMDLHPIRPVEFDQLNSTGHK